MRLLKSEQKGGGISRRPCGDLMSIRVFHKARYQQACIVLALILLSGIMASMCHNLSDCAKPHENGESKKTTEAIKRVESLWVARNFFHLISEPDRGLIEYGKQLIEHTSVYLGPNGKVMKISNGMNCQNCHLQSGTKIFGNNYSAVASTYPKFRPRSGTIESVEKRINDCIERSLNGTPLDERQEELKAMAAYILWVGRSVERGKIPEGAGLMSLPFLDRAASPDKGSLVYKQHCERCHGAKGEGQRSANATEWTYPPLAGPDSYNTAAGLYRISKFASFVKANMPFGVSFQTSVLSNEEAWDVAAFVNSLPRPEKTFKRDWPDISTKPFDYPVGPYADHYSETTHKFGPFVWMKNQEAR
jgi:thiosulfate dehydrogenase